jgi:uncharacterized protein (TIGR03084 family)
LSPTTAAGDGIDDLVADLEAEQVALQSLLRDVEPSDWLRPTPAWQWDVRDSVSHLADTDELAIDTMRDGPRSLGRMVASHASAEDVTYEGVRRGRRRSGADVLAWWEAVSHEERATLRALDPATRVPWGLGMRPPSFVTARLMETWAHGLDVYAALGVEPVDTPRLRHVAWIATRAVPYAFSVVARAPPSAPLRVELTLPDGTTWDTGPADAADRITGPAGEYCRVFVQRLRAADAPNLRAEGDAARAVLAVARAYL